MGQYTPFSWGTVFYNFRRTWRVLMKLYHQIYISQFFLLMEKWLFLTPLFTEEYLRTKISTSNSRFQIWYETFTRSLFHFVAASSIISFWISKFTPVTRLKWWCHHWYHCLQREICVKNFCCFFLTSSTPKFQCKYVLFHYPATLLSCRSFITPVTWINPGA